jgi:hypothetical protein
MRTFACDESGSEGENLVHGETDVFAYASVHVTTSAAAACVAELRDRIRSPALEYKANHLLRAKHRAALTWLLGPAGPISGHALVHLTDKTFFLVGKVIDVLVDEIGYADSIGRRQKPRAETMTRTLYRDGPRTFGSTAWPAFLESFIELKRTTTPPAVDAFFHIADKLGESHEIMRLIAQARPAAEAFRAQLLDNPKAIPPLDPLMPAILRTVAHWYADGETVSIVHDEQPSLTDDRVTQLMEKLGGRLAGIRFVDSRSDPRVQVADFLAGVARRIASEELNTRGDAELTALLRPYVDPTSTWGDNRSGALLGLLKETPK